MSRELSHDWTGPTRVYVHVHCKRCLKVFEIGKAKGPCHGNPALKLVKR